MEIEHFFTCPYCWEDISFVIDLSVEQQTYIEDCEVCCRPIQITYSTDGGDLADFFAESVDE
ncbi:MAG TPA: CPXCG motif-containing cysteine-rich protein [Pyrinomonadaceae bacterium]|nr:CPXCG motif-containing cysteine-rich protein [Pyrinomonadaceae bacterium]